MPSQENGKGLRDSLTERGNNVALSYGISRCFDEVIQDEAEVLHVLAFFQDSLIQTLQVV